MSNFIEIGLVCLQPYQMSFKISHKIHYLPIYSDFVIGIYMTKLISEVAIKRRPFDQNVTFGPKRYRFDCIKSYNNKQSHVLPFLNCLFSYFLFI